MKDFVIDLKITNPIRLNKSRNEGTISSYTNINLKQAKKFEFKAKSKYSNLESKSEISSPQFHSQDSLLIKTPASKYKIKPYKNKCKNINYFYF
jgi:hypothetical protein